MDPRVRQLYKKLLFIGREYPAGYEKFRAGCKAAFLKKRDLPADQVQKAIEHGEYVYKELEALWFLKKYRSMKTRYYDQ